jgi:hypothetical protein
VDNLRMENKAKATGIYQNKRRQKIELMLVGQRGKDTIE